MNTTRYKSTFAFVDLLFNLLVGFTFLFMLAFILINPVAKKEVLDPKAEYLIVVSWDDKSQNDIDVWVKDNDGNAVSFRSKDIALMNIDRDDLGARNDTFAEIVGARAESLSGPAFDEIVLIINHLSEFLPLSAAHHADITCEKITTRGLIPARFLRSRSTQALRRLSSIEVRLSLNRARQE